MKPARQVPEVVEAVRGNYFELLGVDAGLGRALGPADDRENAELAIVLGRIGSGRPLTVPIL